MFDSLAYVDPGAGSLIIQALIATLVAVPFFFRQQIGRIVRRSRRRIAQPTPTAVKDANGSMKDTRG